MKKPELRFYCFVNFYLSSIQQGIQTGHCSVRLLRKYLTLGKEQFTMGGWAVTTDATVEKVKMVEDWADNWETYIVLNGGDFGNLQEIHRIIADTNDFPYVPFYESVRALDNLMTCVGVVLPETIFNAKRTTYLEAGGWESPAYLHEDAIEDPVVGKVSTWYRHDHKYYPLIDMLKSCRLAS